LFDVGHRRFDDRDRAKLIRQHNRYVRAVLRVHYEFGTFLALGYVVNGLIALALSLAIWHTTHSYLGWAVLFVPGAALVLWGWRAILKL
jgi:hypothetical protein